MNFEEALRQHLARYPKLMPQDLIKFCFQATFGAEHLLLDEERARVFFHEEYQATKSCNMPLYEDLNEQYVRVNLPSWKYFGKEEDALLQAFLRTAQTPSRKADASDSVQSEDAAMKAHFSIVSDVLRTEDFPITPDMWENARHAYLEKGIQPVHHSVQYREEYKPAYRVIRRTILSDGGDALL